MRIAIAGSGRLGAGLFAALAASSHEVVALLQDGRKTRGARRWMAPLLAKYFGSKLNVQGLARRQGMPIFWIDKMDELELAPIRTLELDLILVCGFSIILKAPLIRLPRIGCVNTHSSLLPAHRGPNPFSAAILSGDSESGVTFHIVEEGIDTGDIIEQFSFPLTPDETMLSLYRRACEVAAEHAVSVINRVDAEGLHGTPQDPEYATYDKKILPAQARIDWRRSALEIDRFVRALAPTPMPWFPHQERQVRVLRVHYDSTPIEAEPGTVLENRPMLKVATGSGVITLRAAFALSPWPWPWPSPLSRPEIGGQLELPDD